MLTNGPSDDTGATKMSTSPLFKAIWPFFEQVRLENANAFTWNILLSESAAVASAVDNLSSNKAAAGRHTDDTLTLHTVKTAHNSFETDVLYMRIPSDMSGMCYHTPSRVAECHQWIILAPNSSHKWSIDPTVGAVLHHISVTLNQGLQLSLEDSQFWASTAQA